MRRTLLIRPGAIGDTILSLPALEHLKGGYTEVWVRREVCPLIGWADRVEALADTGIDMVEIDAHAGTMEKLASFPTIHSWYGTGRDEFRAAVRHLPFQFHPALPPVEGVHAADFFAARVGAPLPAVPRIAIGEVERHGAVVIHPFSGSERKNWPLGRFEELGRRVKVEWAARPGWVCFAKLDELARWLAGASVFVGNDSGITHLAAAVGTPVVALFGPTDPAVWAPRGANVRIIRRPAMEQIEVDEVTTAVQAALRQSS